MRIFKPFKPFEKLQKIETAEHKYIAMVYLYDCKIEITHGGAASSYIIIIIECRYVYQILSLQII